MSKADYIKVPVAILTDICDAVREKKGKKFEKYSLKDLPKIIKNLPEEVYRKEQITLPNISYSIIEDHNYIELEGSIYDNYEIEGLEPITIPFLTFAPIELVNNEKVLLIQYADELGDFYLSLDKKEIIPSNIDGSFLRFNGNDSFEACNTKVIKPFFKFTFKTKSIKDIKLDLDNFKEYEGAYLYVNDIKFVIDGNFNISEFLSELARIKNIESVGYLYHPDIPLSLKEGLFKNWNLFKDLVIPESIDKISKECFKNSSLVSVDIPSIDLDESCFENCVDLEKVTFAEIVKLIPNNCFKDCNNLKEFVFSQTYPPWIEEGAFKGVSLNKITCYVPSEGIENYQKDSSFTKFKAIIGV